MPQTPKQKRLAAAKRLERNLPENTTRGGETTMSDADIRAAVKALRS